MKTESAGTPGPWVYEDWTRAEGTVTRIMIGPQGMGRGLRPVAQLVGHANKTRKGEAREPVTMTAREQQDARTLATSWEMAEFCRALKARVGVDTHYWGDEDVNKLNAILAKLDGKL